MDIPDELLQAYVDGQLSERERFLVERATSGDAGLAKRLQAQQLLRSSLQKTYDEVLKEPVPGRLLQSARVLASLSESARVVDLAAVRAGRARRGLHTLLWATPVRIAVAVSLLVGGLLGLGITRLSTGGNLLELRDGTMVARGALAATLTGQLADAVPPGAAIRIGLSFRSGSGNYCRTFSAGGAHWFAGLACHRGRQWQILTLVEGESRSAAAEYRLARSDLPPLLLQAVQQNIKGEPLDAASEQRARSGGWR